MKELRNPVTQEVLGYVQDEAVFSLDRRKVAEIRSGQVFALDGQPMGYVRELEDPAERGGMPPALEKLLSIRP